MIKIEILKIQFVLGEVSLKFPQDYKELLLMVMSLGCESKEIGGGVYDLFKRGENSS